MKNIPLSFLFTFLALSAAGQGINFNEALSWAQLRAKAKAEKKYIFMDVYATWCGPCKKMDQEVYPQKEVADFYNSNFISVKIQTDQTKADPKAVMARYADAKLIEKEYLVSILPTYLFFSPEGILVHRAAGGVTPSAFIQLGKEALDPRLNFQSKRLLFRSGKMPVPELNPFALAAKANNERNLADSAAREYKAQYLDQLPEKELLNLENLSFIKEFVVLLNSKDKYFDLFYHQPAKMDSLLKIKGMSRYVLYHVINRENIQPDLLKMEKSGANPDWSLFYKRIAKKYPAKVAEVAVRNAKLQWYMDKKDWPEVVTYYIERLEQEGIDTAGLGKSNLNSIVFNVIFKHSTDPVALAKGAMWMEMLLKSNPESYAWLDTYANVLYKAGKVKEGAAQQEKAIAVILKKMEETKGKNLWLYKIYADDLPGYQKTLELMKKGLPTWGAADTE